MGHCCRAVWSVGHTGAVLVGGKFRQLGICAPKPSHQDCQTAGGAQNSDNWELMEAPTTHTAFCIQKHIQQWPKQDLTGVTPWGFCLSVWLIVQII